MSRSSYSSPYHPSFVVHRDGYGNSEKNGRSSLYGLLYRPYSKKAVHPVFRPTFQEDEL